MWALSKFLSTNQIKLEKLKDWTLRIEKKLVSLEMIIQYTYYVPIIYIYQCGDVNTKYYIRVKAL